MQPERTLKTTAERAAAEVYEIVRAAAAQAAEDAVRDAIRSQFGVDVPEVNLEDRVTRSEAARQLGTTSQSIMRLEEKDLVHSERIGGRVYVSLSEVEQALRAPRREVQLRAAMAREVEHHRQQKAGP